VIVVITPTYNERDNLQPLAEEISQVRPEVHHLVVDDDSPDGTGTLAESLGRRYPRLHVLHRPAKTGLGDAYRDGFRKALELGAEKIITMDADRSHGPGYLPEIIRGLESSDVVVGSRYLHGISIVNWSLGRLMLSQAANRFARLATGLDIRDCTSGYVGYRRSALMGINPGRTRSQGYVFLIEMKYLARRSGFGIAEIPIIFVDRTQGASKMSARIGLEALWRVALIRLWGLRAYRSRR
jgi:dolichol-phosphate mannosyltransferase